MTLLRDQQMYSSEKATISLVLKNYSTHEQNVSASVVSMSGCSECTLSGNTDVVLQPFNEARAETSGVDSERSHTFHLSVLPDDAGAPVQILLRMECKAGSPAGLYTWNVRLSCGVAGAAAIEGESLSPFLQPPN